MLNVAVFVMELSYCRLLHFLCLGLSVWSNSGDWVMLQLVLEAIASQVILFISALTLSPVLSALI
jgi:hypothetical protein